MQRIYCCGDKICFEVVFGLSHIHGSAQPIQSGSQIQKEKESWERFHSFSFSFSFSFCCPERSEGSAEKILALQRLWAEPHSWIGAANPMRITQTGEELQFRIYFRSGILAE
jgi:hypothetical protein